MLPSRKALAPLLACGMAILAGCDQHGTVGAPDSSTDAADVEEVLDAMEVDGCSRELVDVQSAGQAALLHEEGFLIVQAVISGNLAFPPVDLVQLEIWPDRGGPVEPGTYEIDGSSYDQCGLCLVLRESCTPQDGLARCERDYLASSASVEIVDMQDPGGMFSGVLRDALLVRTLIDWDSGEFGSEPLAGGEQVCLDRLEFESVISPYPSR